MQTVKEVLERALDNGGHLLDRLSTHWRTNANRRTIIILSVIGGVLLFSYLLFVRPPSAFPKGELIEISEGMSLSEIAVSLKNEHVVRSSLLLQAAVYLLGYERGVQFGDYLFKEPRGVFSIARAIGIGAHGLEPFRIRVSEGASTAEIALIFADRLKRFNEESFLKDALPMEGYLFPDTYFFLPNADETLVLRTLRQNFETHIAEIKPSINAFGKPLKDIVIMASILERETHDSEDRRMIAGVLWKRLERGMLLQVDATFRYTLGKGTFDLTGEDLESDDPYNTYVHKGLPPSPIGSPSLDSLLATVTPIESDYWFYLADENNVTYFSETYEEHLQKKRMYLGS